MHRAPLILLLLAGCAAPPPAGTQLPDEQALIEEGCGDLEFQARDMDAMAAALAVPRDRVQVEYCRRFAAAIMRGALTEAQLQDLGSGSPSIETQGALMRVLMMPNE